MVSLVKGSEEEPSCCTAMTWYFSEQMYTMPSVRELPTESPPSYSSDQFMGQNQYVFAHSLDYHQESPSGRFGPQSFPYITQNSDSFGYCQQQYTPAISTQQQSCRDNPFVWIGTNNFYPSPPYEQRYLEDSYSSQQRQCYRRHHNSDRVEKTNNRKRRAPTVAQRRAANIRERRRMYNLNEAFDCLRQRIPTFAYEKRLSRIETLRLAISYISFMAAIVSGEDPNTLRVNTYDSPVCAASSMTQPSLRHGDSIPASQSCDNDEYDDDVDDDVSEDQTDDDDNKDEEDNCKEDDEFQDGHSFHISNGDSYNNVMAKEV